MVSILAVLPEFRFIIITHIDLKMFGITLALSTANNVTAPGEEYIDRIGSAEFSQVLSIGILGKFTL